MEWEEGMQVTVKKACKGCVEKVVYTLKRASVSGTLKATGPKTGYVNGCSCTNNWVLAEIDWEQRTKRGDLI